MNLSSAVFLRVRKHLTRVSIACISAGWTSIALQFFFLPNITAGSAFKLLIAFCFIVLGRFLHRQDLTNIRITMIPADGTCSPVHILACPGIAARRAFKPQCRTVCFFRMILRHTKPPPIHIKSLLQKQQDNGRQERDRKSRRVNVRITAIHSLAKEITD